MLTKLLVQRVEKFAYFILLCTGAYFIYQGDVLERFIEGKTNFYQYAEGVKELPSITTWVDPMLLDTSNIKLGRDFNISLGTASKTMETNLSIGINHIGDYVSVELEQTNNGNNNNDPMVMSDYDVVLTAHSEKNFYGAVIYTLKVLLRLS